MAFYCSYFVDMISSAPSINIGTHQARHYVYFDMYYALTSCQLIYRIPLVRSFYISSSPVMIGNVSIGGEHVAEEVLATI